jgi:iron(III) transport system substrate-binding protein
MLALASLGLLAFAPAHAQGTVSALCSTDQAWCELAALEFQKATGIRVLQTRKPTGEALAQLRAEAANPKTDIWWGGTGDPFLQAAEAGLLQPYRPDYINDLHAWAVRQYAMSQNMVGGFYTSSSGRRSCPSPSAGPTWSSPSTRARSRSPTRPPAARPTRSWPAWSS